MRTIKGRKLARNKHAFDLAVPESSVSIWNVVATVDHVRNFRRCIVRGSTLCGTAH
jgi:hypothetical protein